MSSCLVLQAKDKLYIGADTSSSVFIDDKLYRLNNNTKKLFLLDDNIVLYCAGNNSIAEKVVQHISSVYCRNDFSLISLKNWLIEMYPYKNKDKTVYDVEILIATFKNNRTIVYQMSQYKNYDIVSFEVSDAGVQILSAGIKNAECVSFAENELLNKSGVKSIFRTTFNNLSCNYIGGCLDLYEITKNGAIKIFDNEKINEHGIQYVHDVFNGLSVSLNAEVLVSKLVMSENLWIENNSGNYKFNDSGFTATNGNNTIKIQPNQSGELFSIFKGNNKQFYVDSDGNVHFTGDLTGSSGTFSGNISGGSINIGNGTFTVDSNGNMYASSARISGEVNASSGTIGGWNINYNSLSNSDNSVFISSDGTISGATITGANGEFTEGFKVELPENDYGALVARFCIDANTNQTFIGLKSTDGYYGLKIKNGKVYISGISTGMADDPNHLVYVNGKKAATLSDVPSSTSKLTASYRGNNSDIISFSEPTSNSADYCAATPHWVKSYVGNKIPDTSGFITDFSGDSTPGVYNSIRTSGSRIVGSKISYSDLKSKLSDKRLKKDISSITEPAIEDFYMNLIPTKHKYKNGVGVGEDGKYQFGVIAQWTENDMIDHDINPDLYSIVRKSKPFNDTKESEYTNGEDVYKVDYDQFHALHIYMIQKQQKEIEKLKNTLEQVKEQIK